MSSVFISMFNLNYSFMKKFIMFFVFIIVFWGSTMAQSKCMPLFPQKVGSYMVNESYDSNKKLLSKITYKIDNYNEYALGVGIDVSYVINDDSGKEIDNGVFKARCDNGNFSIKVTNKKLNRELLDYIIDNPQVVVYFMFYPNRYDQDSPYLGEKVIDVGQYEIIPKDYDDLAIKVVVTNREYIKNENMKTPVGTFYSSKITYDVQITNGIITNKYKVIDWYSEGVANVRTEIIDSDNNLKVYTDLTELQN